MLRGTVAAKSFVQSSFSLGRAGVVVANIAWLWLFITSLFLFWPTTFPVDQYSACPHDGYGIVAFLRLRMRYASPQT